MLLIQTLLLALVPLAQCIPTSSQELEARNNAKALFDTYQAKASTNMRDILKKRSSGCTLRNVIVRKEWNALSLKERIGYTNAVVCLKSKAPRTPSSYSTGTKSRFDDFQATHVAQSSWVHWSVYFLPWHRYLVHSYETALRDECGYSGAHPYWEWSLNNANISAQAIFSGAAGSFGGNGLVIPNRGPVTLTIPSSPPRSALVPAGTGGGCITSGPFANFKSNLGPFGPPLSNTSFNYNPTCITRDFRPASLMASSNYANVASMLASPDLDTFMVGMNSVHGSGHTSIGGLQGDLFTSNGDPVFYLHHGQVDRLWSVWQALDFENRKNQVTGTLTLMNTPPSANGTLNTVMDLGYNGGPKTAKQLASTIDGDFCYIYA